MQIYAIALGVACAREGDTIESLAWIFGMNLIYCGEYEYSLS